MDSIKHINEVHLIGRVGSAVKFAKSKKNGNEYMYVCLEINDERSRGRDSDYYHYSIHVSCFNAKIVKECIEKGLQEGNLIEVYGWVSSYKGEVNGRTYLATSICAREVNILKQKKKD